MMEAALVTARSQPQYPYRITRSGPGWAARVQLWMLKRATGMLLAVGRHNFFPMVWLVGRVFRRSNYIEVEVEGRFRVRIGLGDPYWMNFILGQTRYEPELHWLLDSRALKRVGPVLFVDCGANIGWWSLLATGLHDFHCLAIEPSTHLADQIEFNQKLSRISFPVIRKAVWKEDDRAVTFLTGLSHHAGGHIKDVAGFVKNGRVAVEERVTTVTVDALVEGWKQDDLRDGGDGSPFIIVKLDVEGAETQAMEGCSRTLNEQALLLYEDHGSDTDCKPTRAALSLDLAVYALGDTGGILPVESLETAQSIKKERNRGYNFAAVKRSSKAETLLKEAARG